MSRKWIPMWVLVTGLLAPCLAQAEPTAPGANTFEGLVIKANDRLYGSTLRMRGPASSCTAPKSPPQLEPGSVIDVQRGNFYTDLENVWVNDGPAQCVKVEVEVPEGDVLNADPAKRGCDTYDPYNPARISLVAYLGSFDPLNAQTNYLADIGTALASPSLSAFEPSKASMTFVAPANSTIQFALANLPRAANNTGGCFYKFTVTKVEPATNELTSVPTLSEWATLALAGVLGLLGLAAVRRRG